MTLGEIWTAAARSRINPRKIRTFWLLLMFLLAAYTNVLLVSMRWSDPLLDHHAFRQTQTAFTVWAMLNDGPMLRYETPVLGKPWSIPFEFPLYQWLVYGVVQSSGMPIDQAGRLVSVASFYLLLGALWLIVGHVCSDPFERLVPLTFVLASPLYVFWSRSVMIESTALLLAASFLVFFLRLVQRPGWVPFTLTIAVGALAAAVKVTTFAVAGACAGMVTLQLVVRLVREGRVRTALRTVILTSLPVVAATSVAMGWTIWADRLKARNAMANGFITSSALTTWNFGTIEQKLSLQFWSALLERSGPEILGGPGIAVVAPLTIVGVAAFFSRRYRAPAILALLTFMVGPALFTNLYAVHTYYFYANGVALLLFGGFGALALIERGGQGGDATFWFGIPLVVILLFWSFWTSYYSDPPRPVQAEVLRTAAAIARVSAPSDVLVVYGHDWNPAIPYYARRRALMDPWDLDLKSPKARAALTHLRGERIGAMLVGGSRRGDAEFIRERAAVFGLSTRPAAVTALGDVYARDSDLTVK